MRPGRLLVAAAVLPLGGASALAAVLLHGRWWGLALGVLAAVTAVAALPPGWWSRVPYAAGWAGVVAYLVVPRGEGDFLLAQDPAGYAVLGTALLVAVLALATLPRPGRMTGRADPAP